MSWCMRSAGASKVEFPATASHAEYAKRAWTAAEDASGPFRARRVELYAPQPGDIVHVNRNGGKVTYDQIADGGYPAESGIVIDVSTSEVVIVMGNQLPPGNVGTESLALTRQGLLMPRHRDAFICVIEVLK